MRGGRVNGKFRAIQKPHAPGEQQRAGDAALRALGPVTERGPCSEEGPIGGGGSAERRWLGRRVVDGLGLAAVGGK